MESESSHSQVTVRCFLCRAISPEKLLKSTSICMTFMEDTGKNEQYNNWAQSCIESITRVLKIPEVNSNFLYGSYCQECLQLLRDINFSLIQLDNFRNKIINFRKELLDKFGNNYDAIPNKDLITTNYSDIEYSKNHKNRFSFDEVVKVVYEQIKHNIKDENDLDFMYQNDNHQQYVQIPMSNNNIRRDDDIRKNVLSKNQPVTKSYNENESGRGRRCRNVVSYDEQIIKLEKIYLLNDDNSNDSSPDFQGDYDSDWNVSDTESVSGKKKKKQRKLSIETNVNNDPHEVTKTIGKFQCPDISCGRRFTHENSLVIHQRKAHEGDRKPYHCEFCQIKCKSSTSFTAHMRQHKTSDQSFPCLECGKSYPSKFHLQKHVNRTHYEKYPMCSFCDMPFEKAEDLMEHESIHKASEQPYKCTTCDATFTNCIDLKRHSRSHSDKNCICDTCGIRFSHGSNLRKHRRIHDPSYIGHKCDVCSHIFYSKSVLDKHMLKHSNEKKYICEICGSSFKYDSGLKRHSRKHDGVFPFVCKICGKGFTVSHYLKQHEEIHSGTLAYECNVCHKKFRTNISYQQHLKTHGPKNTNPKNRIRIKELPNNLSGIPKGIETQSRIMETINEQRNELHSNIFKIPRIPPHDKIQHLSDLSLENRPSSSNSEVHGYESQVDFSRITYHGHDNLRVLHDPVYIGANVHSTTIPPVPGASQQNNYDIHDL